MRPDVLADWAQVGTFVVIFGSVIAAMIQLRHIRAGNQLEALLSLQREFRTPELQAALTYLQEQLPQRLEDSAYRQELERIGYVDTAAHPEMVACNWLNVMGTLVARGYVSEDAFMDLFARLIVYCWRQVAPAIAIMRRTRGEGQYHDFEYLAARAAAWVKHHPRGTFPLNYRREPLADRWFETDRRQAVES
ncbi:MAG: hypothetical protein JO146_01445 [Candidatus Eremiobacteraeota bacterium]|nr:hypothetical protein [Candidatus Eremiobacteraeota bacterium]